MLLTTTQQSIAESVRAFAQERVRPRAAEFAARAIHRRGF
jgi:hypothetical protein